MGQLFRSRGVSKIPKLTLLVQFLGLHCKSKLYSLQSIQEQTPRQVKHTYMQMFLGTVFAGVPFSPGELSTVFSCIGPAIRTSIFLKIF